MSFVIGKHVVKIDSREIKKGVAADVCHGDLLINFHVFKVFAVPKTGAVDKVIDKQAVFFGER